MCKETGLERILGLILMRGLEHLFVILNFVWEFNDKSERIKLLYSIPSSGRFGMMMIDRSDYMT